MDDFHLQADGLYASNRDGDQIMFSAGEPTEVRSDRTLLEQQMQNLEMLSDHRLLGRFSETMADIDFEEADDESSDLRQALQDMGKSMSSISSVNTKLRIVGRY